MPYAPCDFLSKARSDPIDRLEEVLVKEKRLRGLMETRGLDGILLKEQPDFSWFTAGGLNMVGIATEMGMTSLLVTRTGRYLIANKIEAPRMMNEEGLADLGFQLLEHEWYVDREADLVEKVAGSLGRVGAYVGFGGCQNVDGDIKKLRYSLTGSEIERYLFLGEKLSAALEKVMLGIRPVIWSVKLREGSASSCGRTGSILQGFRSRPMSGSIRFVIPFPRHGWSRDT